MEAFLFSILILTFAAIASYFDWRISIALSILALISTLTTPFAAVIFAIALLNIVSLLAIKKNQIAGVDYAMVSLIAVATVFAFISKDPAELLTAFVVASIPTYLLVMISEDRPRIDIGIKYIAFMVLATVLFIIGASLLFFSYPANYQLYLLGFILLLLGLSLEVGVAPLHEWVPDVFAEANPIAVSIIASIAKFVPFIVAFKILASTAMIQEAFLILAIFAAISMFAGNIGALTSENASRILAYSTVANMGYILAALTAIAAPKEVVIFAIAGALLQLLVNAFGKIGLFAAVKENTSAFSVYMLSFSFIGLPPLMGFWSKLFIIYAVANAGFLWLAIILVLNSAISVPYYLRLVRILGTKWRFSVPNAVTLFSALAMLVTVIPPIWILEIARVM